MNWSGKAMISNIIKDYVRIIGPVPVEFDSGATRCVIEYWNFALSDANKFVENWMGRVLARRPLPTFFLLGTQVLGWKCFGR